MSPTSFFLLYDAEFVYVKEKNVKSIYILYIFFFNLTFQNQVVTGMDPDPEKLHLTDSIPIRNPGKGSMVNLSNKLKNLKVAPS